MQTQAFKELSDEQWEKIRRYIPNSSKQGRPRSDDRLMVNAILFVLKAHIPWNYLPEKYGDDSTANRRFRRWQREGVWAQIAGTLVASGYSVNEL